MSYRLPASAIGGLALCVVVGCSAAPASSDPASVPSTATAASSSATVPTELVGTWETVTERGNAFSYEIRADGKYLYTGLMPDGDLEYTLQEGGRATVADGSLTFTPQRSLLTRKQTGQNDRQTWQTRPPRTFVWSVRDGELTLTGGGASATYTPA
jgi:hypothetical protein